MADNKIKNFIPVFLDAREPIPNGLLYIPRKVTKIKREIISKI
jgi:hypothetical protein